MVVCWILSLDTYEKPRSFVCPDSLTIGHDTDKVTIQRCANILMECLRSITRTIYARFSLRCYDMDIFQLPEDTDNKIEEVKMPVVARS